MFGFVMIYYRKIYKKYYILVSRVVVVNLKLKDVKGIVMDGEEFF